MPNLMDTTQYNQQNNFNIQQAYQQAMQNPQAFIEQIKRANPQAYQRALQLASCNNPQMIVMQMLQSRGLNPNMFNMSGLK